jgi:hypothetical protein
MDSGKNNTCVKAEECTCMYRGQHYETGDLVQVECNECVCQGGKWSCTDKKCPRVCAVYGMGHFRTFDGKTFDFRSNCQYVLVEQIDPSEVPNLQVLYKHTHTNLREGPVDLTIRVMNTVIVIRQSSVLVDSLLVPSLPHSTPDVYIRQLTDFFIGVYGKEFAIWFDGWRVYIRLDQRYIGNVRGLCGTYNFKSSDDFTPPNGIVESDVYSFANSYKLDLSCNSPNQHSPCEQHISVREFFFIKLILLLKL